MKELGRGLDHVAYVDGNLVIRVAQGDDAAAQVEREATLLVLVAQVSPLPVPRPVLVEPERGRIAYELLPGVPLIDVPDSRRIQAAESVARELGRLLRALHDIDRRRVETLVDVDDDEPGSRLNEATSHYSAVSSSIPDGYKAEVEAFLAARPPAPAEVLVFSHNDPGIEHVLVDPDTLAVTGIIDWSDAALTDPARDFGLLLRDLGTAALTTALETYAPSGATSDLLARASYARCALLEDLAYGVETGRDEYAAKSLAGLEWLFA